MAVDYLPIIAHAAGQPTRPYNLTPTFSDITGSNGVTGAHITSLSITHGKDNVLSLSPARPPQMSATIIGPAVWATTRPYAAGELVQVYITDTRFNSGNKKIHFAGVLNQADYRIRQDKRAEVSLDAYGNTFLLNGFTVNSRLFTNTTATAIITDVLRIGGWPTGSYRQVSTRGFTTPFTYWWVARTTPWRALVDLLNSVGPPAEMHENQAGQLIIQGLGWPQRDTTSDTVFGGSDAGDIALMPGFTAERDELHVIDRASVRIADYNFDTTKDLFEPPEFVNVIIPNNPAEVANVELQTPYDPNSLSAVVAFPVGSTHSQSDLNVTVTSVSAVDIRVSIASRTAVSIPISGVTIRGRQIQEVRERVASAGSGSRQWHGRPYRGLHYDHAQALAHFIVSAYDEGIRVFRMRVFANKDAATLNTLLALDIGDPISFEYDGQELSCRVQQYRWVWDRTAVFVDLSVDLDHGVLSADGGPFIVGTSTWDSNAYFWES